MHTSRLLFMYRSIFLAVLMGLFNFPMQAQVAIGQWKEHLPYDKGVMVADAGDWIYAASESGLFKHHKSEGDIVRLSKVSGLSDIGYSAIAWNDANSTLVIAYANTNIDLIQDGGIINIPDIKDKSILGKKAINDIHIKGDIAYLACGFGIVVLDLIKQEIKDTYFIGSNGSNVDVLDIATSETMIYACTDQGVYKASLTGTNLANFENWSRFENLPMGEYNAGTWFNNMLFVNINVPDEVDTVFFYTNNNWFDFNQFEEQGIQSLESANDRLIISVGASVIEYNSDFERVRFAYDYGEIAALPNHATVDSEGTMWIADKRSGLVKLSQSLSFDFIRLNGPSGTSSFDMSIWDGRCYVASGSVKPTWANLYNKNGLYSSKDNEWKNIGVASFPETASLSDYIRVLVDPFDSKRVYASAWGKGLVEYYDDEFVEFYDTTNSTLLPFVGINDVIRISGMEIDRNTGTLWLVESNTIDQLFAKTQSGDWHVFHIDAIGSINLSHIAIDNIGQKWIIAPQTGVVVYNDNGTLENPTDDQSIKLTQNVNNGNLNSNEVLCLTADFDGEIWAGTDNGVCVFYSPESVFSGGNFDAQQILVEQDGYVQYLLENEHITAIEVDGANRKWIGTTGAGIFLMSEDGTEEILHFTAENSPLFSNQIRTLGIDHLSGEVFIGTEKGIISYKGTATWGTPEFEQETVYAYPNPVEPDYDGPIAIKGLVKDADVKITDAAGNTVFATTANGGQAIWDGNSLNGSRAKSGVYLVFAASEDGEEAFVTKILFIN